MNLTSSAFENDRVIPKKYSCEGIGMNPPLRITDYPMNTVSFAILVHDPDAPVGDFLHWLIWNVDPNVDEIAGGSAPIGSVEGINGMGELGWVGPCPPHGLHHYEFHIYALDKMLEIPETSTRSDFLQAIDGHVLEEATLVGLYEKENI